MGSSRMNLEVLPREICHPAAAGAVARAIGALGVAGVEVGVGAGVAGRGERVEVTSAISRTVLRVVYLR